MEAILEEVLEKLKPEPEPEPSSAVNMLEITQSIKLIDIYLTRSAILFVVVIESFTLTLFRW